MGLPLAGLGGLPSFTGFGNVQGGQQDGGTPQNVAETSAENPSTIGPDGNGFILSDVVEEDQQKLVKTISDYRGSWAQDHLERSRQWMENIFYWKGVQVIRWDTSTNCWYDVLAWARSNNQDNGEDTDLERWINPITLMFGNVFTGTMSRAVPKTVIKPANADPDLQDTVTAKAAVKAIGIIERKNEIRLMVRTIFEMFYLFGCYFRYTRPVIDGKMFGYDEEPEFADMQVDLGPHFHCPQCGTDTPADGSSSGMNCPKCGAWMGQESFYGAGEGSRLSMTKTGTKRSPRAGVKWSLHSPLEIDCDPKARGDCPLSQTPILAKDMEIDFGEACMMFPKFRESIEPGAEASTTPNASVEKLQRLNQVSALGGMTADNSMMNPTYSEVWMQPMSYYRLKDWAFGDRMKAKFPNGLKISFIGQTVVDIRAAVLTKEWSHSALYTNQGVYCAALANTAVSFNARFNRAMWILDDWAARASTGLNFADPSRIDTEKMSGKKMVAGTLTPLPMKLEGQRLPIAEALMHFDLPINQNLWGYPMLLMTFAELILGIPRQLGGQGTQDDVETLGGQQLQLARGMTTLKPYFENVQTEHAIASQNAIECLQALMKVGAVTKIMEVVESQGGAFKNEEVDWTKMQGQVEISVDTSQNLPMSEDELQTAIQTMWEGLQNGNPAAVEWWSVPANQDLAASARLPGSVIPNEAQQLKTEADIQTILEKGPDPQMNPDGSITNGLPVHPVKTEDFPVAKAVVSRYINEHFELRVDDSKSWILLQQYHDELLDMEQQVAAEQAQRNQKVQQAGAPPQPQPDQGTMAAVQELQKMAVQMVDRLAQLSAIDPLITKQSISGQKDAAKAVVDSALDATKAVTGGK